MFDGRLIDLALDLSFLYPLFMSYLWMIGGIYYFYHWERKFGPSHRVPPRLARYPSVSLVVPCHNEGINVRETIEALLAQDYPEFDVIAINDASSDETGPALDTLAAQHPRLRVIHFPTNQGKAAGLRMGALVSPHEFLICIDGDALLEPTAVHWIMWHFVNGPRVGAVTGNPRIRSRSTLLGRIQVGEFSSIIGIIKRAQRIYGHVFTVSGVVAGFRKAALHRVGYWSIDMVTEDIDISWKLQLDHWAVRYEPNALCWILAPETLRGLWRQRVRWAQGGAEVLLKYAGDLLRWQKRRMWLVYLELLFSVLWAHMMVVIIALSVVGAIVPLPEAWRVGTLVPQWTGVVLAFTCLLQFTVALVIDSRYEPGIGRYYYWLIWYPLAYWLLSIFTAVAGMFRAIVRRRGRKATWVSPDRGVRYPERKAA
ncbi:MAG: poly-beta-1,6-N-acetyl-D-glucosamine synthase [Gammaproteobacteria bacterium]